LVQNIFQNYNTVLENALDNKISSEKYYMDLVIPVEYKTELKIASSSTSSASNSSDNYALDKLYENFYF
jgi:uridine kinase